MGITEQVGVYALATVVQLPFHLAVALPWVLGAGLAAVFLRKRVTTRTRFVLVSALAAVGLAPAYGFHLSMIPMYSLVLAGLAEPYTAAISFFATWAAILLVGFAIARFRNRRQPPGANPPLNTDAGDKAARAG